MLITAFEGWNDAGDAATAAVRHLRDRLHAVAFADIDPEPFFDFTSARPQVVLDGGVRRIDWPSTSFAAVTRERAGTDLVLLLGSEPQLRWRTFCDTVLAVARQLDARLVVTLGALLAEVPHTRPTTVFGSTEDPRVGAELDLEPSGYEGPTGIVGVLHDACTRAGIPTVSLWAAVPSYVPGATSPKAALALLGKLTEVVGIQVPTLDLEIASAGYERQVSTLVGEDDDTEAYVRHLEERYDDEDDDEDDDDELIEELVDELAELAELVDLDGTGEALAEEVEQFLRNQPE